MLSNLKQFASGWIAQLLLAILVISFAVWGISDIFTGFGSNAVAQVGNQEISVLEFQRRYQNAVRSVGNQLNQSLTPDQALQYGIPSQVLNQLVTEATFDTIANRMGLGISNDALGREIANDPQLKAPTGNFDRTYLKQIIAAQNMTEDDFILERRDAYTRNQLIAALAGGRVLPDAYMKAVHEYRENQRDLSYVVLSAPPVADIADPSDSDLQTYFDAHKADWKAPEYRAISYFILSPQDIADPNQVSDEEAKTRYDSQQQQYTVPAQRQVEQIVFKDRAEAEAAEQALAAGKSFEDLAKERGLQPSDYDLGLITRDKIVDPAVAEAAFAAAENSTTPIIDGRFGPVIVHIKGAQEGFTIGFDEVKADIKQQIALERATDDVTNLHNSIEDARAGGASLADAAAKFDLKMTTVPAVDQGGKDPDGNAVPNMPVAVLIGAFQSDVGLENNPVEPDRSTYAWFDVTGVTPARDRTLDEVHNKVVAAWKDDQSQQQLADKASKIKSRVEGGETLDAVSGEMSLTVQRAPAVTRLTNPSGDLSAGAIASAFGGGQGRVAVAAGAQPNTMVVLVVDSVTQPPYFSGDPGLADIHKQLDSQVSGDMLALYATQLRGETNVRLNDAAIRTVVGLAPN